MDDSIEYYKPKNNLRLVNQSIQKSSTDLVSLTTSANYDVYEDGYTVVPDVRGMSIRKAKKILIAANIRPNFTGSGHVTWQSPKPGTKIWPGSLCKMGLN